MIEKRRLGKGLGALIPEALSGNVDVNELPLDQIKQNPFQPRRNFEDEKLHELAASIKEHGILQAIVVAPEAEGNGYILVAGERRCRAARMAGLTTIPAVIKAIERKAMLEIALIENLQREDLNPVEEATAYRKLMEEFNYTQEELAGRLGRSRPAIANTLRLLSLSDQVLDLLARGEISPGQARPLLSIEDRDLQLEAAKRIIKERISAREAEKMVLKTHSRSGKEKSREQVGTEDPLQSELQLQIQRALGTKVKIKQGKSGGMIEIYYYSEDDLERLVAFLLPDGL